MKRYIQGIALDLEGTVVDVERAHHDAFLAVCAELNHTMTFDQALARIPGFIGGGDEVISNCIVTFPGVAFSAEQIRLRKMERYERLLGSIAIAPRPGFLDVFATFKRLELPVAIGSLTTTNQAKVLLKRSGLDALIGDRFIVLKEHVAQVKPAPDVFLETARRMGIDPAEQLVFEDSPRGAKAGVAAGSRVIGMPVYTMPKAMHELVDAGVSRIFWDWRELDVEALIANLAHA